VDSDQPEPPTRAKKKVAAREMRKAAQREATLAAAEARKRAESKKRILGPFDACTVLTVPLGVAAMLSDNNIVVATCFTLCGLIACAPVTWHHEIKVKYKTAWCSFVAIVCFGVFSLIANENLAKELARREGTLEVGDAPIAYSCGYNTNPQGLIVSAGTSRLQVTQFPYVLLTLNGEQTIVLDREPNGDLIIRRLIIFDDRNDKIVKIENGKYWVHPNAQWTHPSRSKISVRDHADREVLSLDLQNKDALLFRAQITSGNGVSFSATNDSVSFSVGDKGPATIYGFCLVDGGFYVDKNGHGIAPGGGIR
jgi:hypothetical protein